MNDELKNNTAPVDIATTVLPESKVVTGKGLKFTGLGKKAKEINEVNQDLEFGGQKTLKKQDRLSWENLDIRHLRYYKVNVNDKMYYGFCLPGEELKGDLQKYGTYIGIQEFLEYAVLGPQEWRKLKGHYRNYKRMMHMEELELIRNSPIDEAKLLGKDSNKIDFAKMIMKMK